MSKFVMVSIILTMVAVASISAFSPNFLPLKSTGLGDNPVNHLCLFYLARDMIHFLSKMSLRILFQIIFF